MADQTVRFDWQVDDSQVEKAVQKYIDAIDEVQGKVETLGETQDKAFSKSAQSLNAQEKALKDNIQQQTGYNQEVTEGSKKLSDFEKGVRDATKGMGLLERTILGAVQKLASFQVATKQGEQATTRFGRAWRVLNNIIKASVIGAVIGALVGLLAALRKTQAGIDSLRSVTAGLTAALNVVIDRVISFGTSVFKTFQAIARLVKGDLRAAMMAAEEAADATIATFTGLGRELVEVTRKAIALERVLIAVEKSERRVAAQRALQAAEITRLSQAVDDTTNSYNKRISALEDLKNLEASLNAQEIDNARRRVAVAFGETEVNDRIIKQIDDIRKGRIDLNELGLTSATEEQVDALLKDVQLLGQLEQESFDIVFSRQSKLNDLRQEQRDRIQAVIEKTQELQNVAADANADLEGGAAVVEREFQKAIDKVEELKQAAREIGIDVDFSALEQLAENQRQLALDAVKGIRAPFDALPTALEQTRKDLTDVTGKIKQDIVSSVLTPFQQEGLGRDLALLPGEIIGNLQESLNREAKNKLKLEPDVKDFLVGQFFDIFDSVGEVISLGLEGQAQRQQEVIDRIQADIDRLSSELNDQLDRQQKGYANDAEAFKQNIQSKEQELAQAQQRQLELEKKAARQRLVLDSLQQASQLSLAVARLISSSASLGPFGIIAAATAGVSFIFSTIAKAKALALENSQPVGFATGTEYVDGPGTWTSDSVPALLSRGERVFTGAQNHKIGGRGVSNEEVVDGYLFGQSVLDYLAKPGAAGAQNLGPVLAILHQSQQELMELKSGAQIQAMERAYKEAARENADRMIQYWETRPVDLVDMKTGDEIRQWKEGNKINRIRIKEGKNE